MWKKHLAKKQYWTNDDVIPAAEHFFEHQDESFYTTGIQELQHGWKKCVDRWGDYVEKLTTFGQIQPLHYNQTMNFLAHPRSFRKLKNNK